MRRRGRVGVSGDGTGRRRLAVLRLGGGVRVPQPDRFAIHPPHEGKRRLERPHGGRHHRPEAQVLYVWRAFQRSAGTMR
jgi:hypothetical protein